MESCITDYMESTVVVGCGIQQTHLSFWCALHGFNNAGTLCGVACLPVWYALGGFKVLAVVNLAESLEMLQYTDVPSIGDH